MDLVSGTFIRSTNGEAPTASRNLFLIDLPPFCVRQSTWVAGEHCRGFFVVAELPLQPGGRHLREIAAVRFAVGAAVADIQVGCENRHVVDALHIVYPVFERGVFFAAEDVKAWRV